MSCFGASRFLIVIAALATLTACEGYPRDPEGTTQQIKQQQVMRTGLVVADADRGTEEQMAEKIASSVNAQPEYHAGSAEVLMRQLEHKDLDVVIGLFAKDTPWKSRTALSKPYQAKNPKGDKPVLRAAVPLGENRWLMTVEQALGGGEQ